MFPNKNFEGETYSFSHLKPISMKLLLGEEEVSVRVNFGCHCFTEDFDPLKHKEHHRYTYRNEVRAFNLIRYNLSLNLPSMIRSELPTGTIRKSEDNYTYLTHLKLEYDGIVYSSYPIFFSIEKDRKTSKGVVIFIKSAYPKEGMKFAVNAMRWRFKSLVAEFSGLQVPKKKSKPKKQERPRRALPGA